MQTIIYDILVNFSDTLFQMAPYLLIGFLTAGLLSVFIKPETIEKHLGGRGMLTSVKAAVFGVPLPLCSCGIIPVSASLRRHGAGKGATTAFLLSTPQASVESVLVTLALLGPVWAIYRPVAALVAGILGGMLVSLLVPEKEETTAPESPADDDADCADGSCAIDAESGIGFVGKIREALSYGFITLPADIGRAMLIGIFIAAVITAVVPEDFFAAYIGAGIGAILILMVAGIPVYVCAVASVPIAAALINSGVSPGAAWAFLVAGPATNAATVAIVWKVMGFRTTLLYMATVALTAIGGGLLLDSAVIPAAGEHASHAGHGFLPEPAKYISGAILIAVFLYAVIKNRGSNESESAEEYGESSVNLRISGMTCEHCAENVKKALLGVSGVEAVAVDLKSGIAFVRGNCPDISVMTVALKEAGYDAKEDG